MVKLDPNGNGQVCGHTATTKLHAHRRTPKHRCALVSRVSVGLACAAGLTHYRNFRCKAMVQPYGNFTCTRWEEVFRRNRAYNMSISIAKNTSLDKILRLRSKTQREMQEANRAPLVNQKSPFLLKDMSTQHNHLPKSLWLKAQP